MSKYFKTADGQEFYQENDAKNHAKTLEDKTVTPPSIDVNDIEVEDATYLIDESSTDEGSTDEAPKDEAPKDEAPKEINLSKMTKAQLVAFATDNELTIDADGRSTLDITGNGVARTDDGLELAHVLCFFALVIQQVDLRKIIFAFAKKHHLSLPPLFVPCAGKTAQLL